VIKGGQYGPLRNKARVVAGAFESAVKTFGDAIAYGDRGDRNKKVIYVVRRHGTAGACERGRLCTAAESLSSGL